MKLGIALRVGLSGLFGLFFTNAAMAFDAAGLDVPLLIHGHQNASGKGCRAIRALMPTELAQPWRAVVTRIVTRCEPMAGIDKEPDASTVSVASLRPGAVTLRGIPVAELRHGESWAHGDSQYVLDAPYAQVVDTVGAYVTARCVASFGPAAMPTETCRPEVDAGNGGFFVKTSELGGTWFHPDPENPRRSILAVAWSE